MVLNVSLHSSFGEYDGVIILEAPDDSAAATIALGAASSTGHLKDVKTTTLLSVDETMEVRQSPGPATPDGRAGS